MRRINRRTLLLRCASAGIALVPFGLAGCFQRTPAERRGRTASIAFFSGEPASETPLFDAFRAGLHGQGYVAGRNLRLEYRHADGWAEGMYRTAAEILRLGPDVIVAAGSSATVAALAASATRATPIVGVGLTGDPVAEGLAASLDRPAGRVTGSTIAARDAPARQVLILADLVPVLEVLGVLFNAGMRGAVEQLDEIADAARSLGARVIPLEARRPEHLPAAIEKARRTGVDAIVVAGGALTVNNQEAIVAETLARRIPAIYGVLDPVEVGGLVAYGPRLTSLYLRAALRVDAILRDATPADLPFERAEPELAVNLRTARALGLGVPSALLAQATQLID